MCHGPDCMYQTISAWPAQGGDRMNAADTMYAVTFAGIVVKVCSTKGEATDAARDMQQQHPDATISVALL